MGFHEDAEFPQKMSYGSTMGPEFKTSVIEKRSGVTERVANWPQARIRVDVSYGVKSRSDASELIAFHRVRMGRAYGFRFTDFTDFTTGTINGSTSTFAFDDQIIGSITSGAADQTLQLIKSYTDGGVTRNRTIVKPRDVSMLGGAGLLVGWGPSGSEVLKTETTHYSVNYSTGEIDIAAGQASTGDQVVAGFEFDIPAFFERDDLPVELSDFGNREIPSIGIVEDVIPFAIAEEMFGGGGSDQLAISTDQLIGAEMGRAIDLDPQSGGLAAKLPEINAFPLGGPAFNVYNSSVSNSLALEDRSGNAVATIGALKGAEVWVFPVGSTKIWRAFVSA